MTDFKTTSDEINEVDVINANNIPNLNEGASYNEPQPTNQSRLSVLRVFDPLFSKSPVKISPAAENANIKKTELIAGDELSDESDSEYVDALLQNNSSVCGVEKLIDCTVDCLGNNSAVDSAEEFCSSFSDKCEAANLEGNVAFNENYELDINEIDSTFVVEKDNSSSAQIVVDLTNASGTDAKERNSSLRISYVDLTDVSSDYDDEKVNKEESDVGVINLTAETHSGDTIETDLDKTNDGFRNDINDCPKVIDCDNSNSSANPHSEETVETDLNKTNDRFSYDVNNCLNVVDCDNSTNEIEVEATLEDTEPNKDTNTSITDVLEIKSLHIDDSSHETPVLGKEDDINEVSLIKDRECSKNIKNADISFDIQSSHNGTEVFESGHQVVGKLNLSNIINQQEIQIDELNISTETDKSKIDYQKPLILDNGDHETFEAVGLDKNISYSDLIHNYRYIMDKFALQQQEISDLKLQLNASQQAKTTLELEVRQKEEIVIKTQAEILRQEQSYLQEIKNLKEQLLEKTKQFENGSSKALEQELKLVKQREAEALSELNTRNNEELKFKRIMEEYETALSAKVVEFEKLKDEHDTALKHLANLEFAFSDIHQKYERSKSIIEGFKSNEETLRNELHVLQETLQHQEEKYESLKAHAKAQIEKSNKDMHILTERNDSEVSKLNAVIKRMEIKLLSLETTLEHKNNECRALAELCDQVTGKKV